jgi:hypothetical protein
MMTDFRKTRTAAGKGNPRSIIVHSPADRQVRKANVTRQEYIAEADG